MIRKRNSPTRPSRMKGERIYLDCRESPSPIRGEAQRGGDGLQPRNRKDLRWLENGARDGKIRSTSQSARAKQDLLRWLPGLWEPLGVRREDGRGKEGVGAKRGPRKEGVSLTLEGKKD